MYSLGYRVCAIVSLFAGAALALPHAVNPTTMATRSADTCADASLVDTVFEAFEVAGTAHQLNFLEVFENSNSGNAVLNFANELPAFKAWPSQQDFLSPLFQLAKTSPRQVIYALGTNATTPPVVTGFSFPTLIAWVYSSQVCGSVPLMSATLASASDSYYTISPSVHAGLITRGWSDDGTIAFVLPLYSS